ncbi:MAG: permease-like cell division protein FtsX [Candidatus Pacebacteria bacterium]|nr:permease-like cell division protein FtsX [Candidatus Paceibacterota bacterium]
MFTTLYRVIKYGIQDFWRNGWVSVAATATMVIVLFVFVNLLIFSVVADRAIGGLKEKIDISVYFKTVTPEDEVLKVKRSLESLSEVRTVEYTSREQALIDFKERHKDDPTITEAVAALEGNPLSASLNIKARDIKEYPVIASYLNNQNLEGLVEQVTYNQNELVLKRLTSIVGTAENIGIAIMLVLSAIAVLVTLNTITLSIHSTREEIGIMRMVGASSAFIRGPYIILGIIYGIVAAIASMVLVVPVMSFAVPYIKVLVPEMDIWVYFFQNVWRLLGYQIILGIALGSVSSIIAVRRYLKV